MSQQLKQLLEEIKNRPRIHFGDGLTPLENFIAGFYVVSRVFVDHKIADEKFSKLLADENILKQISIEKQLRSRGFSKEEAIDKYLELLIMSYEQDIDKNS